MRLIQKQKFTLSASAECESSDFRRSFRALWSGDPGVGDFEVPTHFHLGRFVEHERLRQALTENRLADLISVRRRRRRIEGIKELEETGQGPKQFVQAVLLALGVTPQQAARYRAYVTMWAALARRVGRSDRLIQDDDTWIRLTFADKTNADLECFERKALAENLSFLMENRETIFNRVRYRSCVLSGAYLMQSERSVQSFAQGSGKASDERLDTFIALPLGALLSLWADEQMIVYNSTFQEPVHIVRAIGHDGVSRVWVEGILRKSRRWVQLCVRNDDTQVQWALAAARAHALIQDQTPKLWRHFRTFVAYQSTLERFQRIRHQNEDDSAWAQAVSLPGWMRTWAGHNLGELYGGWAKMLEALALVCRRPLTHSMWQDGLPEFSWIGLNDVGRWDRWQEGLSCGVNDHRGRLWTSTRFFDAVEPCITETTSVPSIIQLVSEVSGDKTIYEAYKSLEQRRANHAMAMRAFDRV
jgi:hypothetical protein